MKNMLTISLTSFALAAFVLSGCTDSPEPGPASSSSTATEVDSHAGHSHPTEGPHGGDLIELGNEEYHAELLHPHDHDDDADARETDGDHDHAGIMVYILDGSARNVISIEAAEITLNVSHDGKPEQFKLGATPSADDPEGKSSRFASADKDLLEHFHEAEHVEGTLVLQISGKSYRGKLTHKHEHGHAHGGHAHGEDDALVWRGESREHAGLQIQLGHHGKHLHAGESVEPAVSITRDGQPVGDAKVFNSLLSADGESVVAEEVATVFEPTTKDEPAHYAQGALSIPKGVDKVVIRFRIVSSDADDVTFDVPVDLD